MMTFLLLFLLCSFKNVALSKKIVTLLNGVIFRLEKSMSLSDSEWIAAANTLLDQAESVL